MKKNIAVAILYCCCANMVVAQKESGPFPYNKEKLDSLFRNFPKFNQPFVLPAPKGYTFPENLLTENLTSFEAYNPGVTIINKTGKGIIYNMPLDNMAVLVPDMNTAENMQGSNRRYRPSPQTNMPNPLMPQKQVPKK